MPNTPGLAADADPSLRRRRPGQPTSWRLFRSGARWDAVRRVLARSAALSAALLGSVACSQAQPGAAVPAGWTSTSVYAALGSIPATFASRYQIGLVDPTALIRVALVDGDATPTTAASSGGRPPSEQSWATASLDGSVCYEVLDHSGSGRTARTAPPGLMLTLHYLGSSADQTLAVCPGAADPAVLADPRERGVTSLTAQTVSGIAGTVSENAWVGYRSEPATTFVVGVKVPIPVRDAVVAGTPASGSLAQDPGVSAVLAALPRAAMIEMGRVLLRDQALGGSSSIAEALKSVMATQGVAALPVAAFAGYGWTPGPRVVGTGTFVTTYGSVQEAGTVAAVLTALWSQVPNSLLGTATTTTSATTVVTSIPEVKPGDLTLQTPTLAGYPGFQSRR